MTSITVDLRPWETKPKVLLAVGRMLMELGGGSPAVAASDFAANGPDWPDEEDNDLAAKLAEANTGTVQGWQETDTGALIPSDALPTVDAQGLPWDARIHAETKALNKDGTWRRRRNLDPAILEVVEPELRGQTAAPAAVPLPPAPVAAPPPPPPPPPSPPIPPLPPVSSVPPAPSATAAAHTYESFMREVNVAMMSGKLEIMAVKAACDELGLANLLALEGRPDLLPAISNRLLVGV